MPFPMDRGFVVFHYWAPAYGDKNGRSTKVDERLTNGKERRLKPMALISPISIEYWRVKN